MSVIGSNVLAGASGSAVAGYEITRSLRFNSADSAYLNRTPSSAGNRKTWTWSAWVKRSNLGSFQTLFGSHESTSSDNNRLFLKFNTDDKLFIFEDISGSAIVYRTTDQVFRDASSWYHIVLSVDTTQSTADDRIKFYVNGEQITSFATNNAITQNRDTFVNSTFAHRIGSERNTGLADLDGYLADVHLIDGQALAPTDFAEYDDNNVWQPKAYAGTYGTNGFHLDFSDNTSTTTIAEDSSGNNNDWTANNISVTAGADNDSLIDTPTNYEAASGNNGGNYATFNALALNGNTLSNGNLDATSGANNAVILSAFGIPDSGKWYFELTDVNSSNGAFIGGVGALGVGVSNFLGRDANGWGYQTNATNAGYWNNNVFGTTGQVNGHGNNTILGVAIDRDSNKLWFSVNGTYVNSGNPATGTNAQFSNLPSTGPLFAGASSANGLKFTLNAGQRPFSYQPSGFKSLCTQNLTDPTIADGSTAMDVALYTGTGATRSITGLGFSPDFVWIKARSSAANHFLFDAVRGIYNRLCSSLTVAEASETNTLTAFNSDGFSLGTDAGVGGVNLNTVTYVAWTWDAGTSTVSNTDGSITSSVRANASAGFSIVSFTATSSQPDVVGHGLNAKPNLIILKSRDATLPWWTWHIGIDENDALRLNGTNAITNLSDTWSPTASTFSVKSVATSGQAQIAYCFAPVEGYSAFGSYTGNGSSDGPFVYTGFRPKFVIIKYSSVSGTDWLMYDSERDTYNVVDATLYPNSSTAENNVVALDFTSNGFKIRASTTRINASSGTFIYAAFAEHPFKTARAR